MPFLFRLAALLTVLACQFGATAPAQAQATRTWVSGVGDDVNPCSRTAPCKTFAGAISKTAASGEISCLDPGGFGALTITKAISINCESVFGSILASGTNGIIINAGASDHVFLRSLEINGAVGGLNGIRIIAGGFIHIDNVRLYGFTNAGILVQANEHTSVTNTHSINNGFGIAIAAGARATIGNAVFSGNSVAGLEVDGGGFAVMKDSKLSLNNVGVLASAGATIGLANNLIASNTTGITGTTTSFGTNQIFGNSSAGTAPFLTGQQ